MRLISSERGKLTRKLLALNTKRWALQRDLQLHEAEIRDLTDEAAKLEAEIIALIGPTPSPETPPRCWCCSCTNQSARDEGCRACWIRTDVQRWIDTDPCNQMTEDHNRGFRCPVPGRAQCPGWEPVPTNHYFHSDKLKETT